MLKEDGRFAIGAASVFYSGILDDIEQHDYDVFHRRAGLNGLGKISRLPGLWWKIRAL
jgi:phytoene synthase